MSLLWQRRDLGDTSTQLTPPRSRSYGTVTISADTAMRHSAVWACLRLRADLLSTMKLRSYRQMGELKVEMTPTPFIANPAGDRFGIMDWLYASQIDLDRTGNCFGIIRARDAYGNPALVELAQADKVSLKGRGAEITSYKIAGTPYEPRDIWHERQFPISGVPLGLSPIAYAAMSIGTYLSASQFGADWFANGSVPAGRLKNTAKKINPKEALIAKDRFRAAVASRDLFVHGADWEYDMISVNANESQFLETMKYGVTDVARFFGVPGDLIDAEALSSAKITYANITQRHLQFLVMSLSAPLARREYALSAALPKPRFVEFDTSGLLRLDPQTQAAVNNGKVAARTMAPSEARAEDNRPPFTDEQYAEFDRLFARNVAPVPVGGTPS